MEQFKKTQQDNRFLLIVQMLVCTLMILFTIINKSSLTSAMFALSFFTLLLLYWSSNRGGKFNSLGWPLLIWSFISILLSYFAGTKRFSAPDLVSYATFAAVILFMQVAANIEVTERMAHAVLFVGTASAALYPIGFFLLHANVYRGAYLTMRFSNPNLTGIYLAQACLYTILCFFLTKKKFFKLIAIVLFVLDMYLLYLTDARNALLTVLLALAGIVFVLVRRIKSFWSWVIFFVAASPLIFALLYLGLIEALTASGRLDFMLGEGKTLDSRVSMWGHVFDSLKGIHWLIGDFTKIRGNMHNTHLTIMGSYGIIGLTLLIKYLTDIMNTVNRVLRSPAQAMCMVCFFGTVFMGNGEAALFYGGMGIYAIACSYLILARYDWKADAPVTESAETDEMTEINETAE